MDTLLHTEYGGASLVFWGAVLFFLGLVQGAAIPFFHNSRLALSGHTTATQSGLALILIGVIWPLINLAPHLKVMIGFALIAGFYLIWTSISLAAATGASRAFPIAGAGYAANLHIERLVIIMARTGSIASLIATAFIVAGIAKWYWAT